MSDHDLDQPDPLDALASAHLDGLTTPTEAQQIAADPALLARVASMAAARQALRTEVPVDAAARDAAIAAALSAFDEQTAVGETGPAPVRAPDFGRTTSRRTLQLVAIAAAVALLALAVPLLARIDDGSSSDDTAATALDDGSDEALSDEQTAGDGAEESAGGTSAEAFAADDDGLEALGGFDDLAGLETALRARAASPAADMARPTTSTAQRAARADGELCPQARRSGEEAPDYRATATLDGRPVLVLVHTTPDGRRELTVVDPTDCSVVATSAL